MWVSADYEATTLFTLKPALATSSGGKTLLVPTPYSIKMALLDVGCQLEGVETAKAFWKVLANATVALRPAAEVVVNNTFTKVLRPRRNEAEAGEQHAGFFGKTIAYREYAYLEGKFGIALEVGKTDDAERIARWLININYLGKRGGFIQLQALPTVSDFLPDRYIAVTGDLTGMGMESILTQLDDTASDLSFERVNIYSKETMMMGKHRLLKHVALPYRRVGSSRSYTHYKRSEE